VISRLHPSFRRDFAKLPRDIQRRARRVYDASKPIRRIQACNSRNFIPRCRCGVFASQVHIELWAFVAKTQSSGFSSGLTRITIVG
jgi:hypothetical protein